MLDQLSPELAMLRETVRQFVDREVIPREREIDEKDCIPEELLEQARTMGLFGLAIPVEYGGAGLKTTGISLVFEELGRSSWGFAVVVGSNSGLGLTSLLVMGTPEQKQRYLPLMATGESRACFALTEPDAGSDASRIRTRAEKKGDRWILNGQKMFSTNAPESNLITVFAVTNPAQGTRGISAFLVENPTPGLQIGPPLRKMGWHGAHTVSLYFEDVEVPEENLLGEVGLGYVTALRTLTAARVTISARSVGTMSRVIDECVRYAKERYTFGHPIAHHQLVQAHLADMAVDHATSRAMVYQTAWALEQGQRCVKEASITKLHVSEALGRVTDRGVQLFGGMGYIQETPVERFYRDARIVRIGDGTSEIQRLMIARHMLNEV